MQIHKSIIGYRQGIGTEAALLLAHTTIEKNNNYRMVCLDLKGAYDRVDVDED